MEDHSSQGALQLQIQCLDLGGKCILAGDVASEQHLQTGLGCRAGRAGRAVGCRARMSLSSIISPSKWGGTLCLSLRITALFSTEDGSVLQCSAEQVLHLSLLCFPTRSMYPILRVAGWTAFVGVEQFLTAVEFRGHYKPKLFSSIFSFRFIPMYNRKMKYQTKLLWIHLSEVFLLFPRCEEVWNNNFSFSSLENQALCYWGADPWQGHGVLTAASAWNAVLKEMRSNSGIPTAGFPLNPKSTTQKSKVKAVGKKEPQTKMHWILNLLS